MSQIQSRILKDRIDVYEETTETNDYSERERTYTYSFNDRAAAMFTNASEAAIKGLEAANKTINFKVRFHLTRYNERQIIKWRNDYYNIRGINQDVDRVFQIITAERTPPDSLNIIDESDFT